LETALAVIVAVAVLHNMTRDRGEEHEFEALDLPSEVNPDCNEERNISGNAIRTALIRSLFR
jgi:hypothetical protein